MESWENITKKIIEFLGFNDYRIEMKNEKQGNIFIYDSPALLKENLPALVEGLNHLLQLIAKKNNCPPVFFDINSYRQEREELIVKLAKAAAKKALATKQGVPLPPMNSYERRIVHLALAVHPEVKTESIGTGKGRYVIVKPIEESKEN